MHAIRKGNDRGCCREGRGLREDQHAEGKRTNVVERNERGRVGCSVPEKRSC
jgi:hypothetical protein